MKRMAILTDVTRCIGCEECVAACRRTTETGPDAPYRWQRDANELSATRLTTIARVAAKRYARVHCRHCLDPSCVAACPVGALRRTREGAVVYDPVICMGCRYCMMACPFGITRYEWNSPTPRIRKCVMCYDKIVAGELTQPACTAACPTQATLFGDREELLEEARRRILDNPGTYVHHIWGEHEIGGTSVLYISDVGLESAGWPDDLGPVARPLLAREVLHTVPYTFLGIAAAMCGIHWTFERRKAVALKDGEARREGEVEGQTDSSDEVSREGEPK